MPREARRYVLDIVDMTAGIIGIAKQAAVVNGKGNHLGYGGRGRGRTRVSALQGIAVTTQV